MRSRARCWPMCRRRSRLWNQDHAARQRHDSLSPEDEATLKGLRRHRLQPARGRLSRVWRRCGTQGDWRGRGCRRQRRTCGARHRHGLGGIVAGIGSSAQCTAAGFNAGGGAAPGGGSVRRWWATVICGSCQTPNAAGANSVRTAARPWRRPKRLIAPVRQHRRAKFQILWQLRYRVAEARGRVEEIINSHEYRRAEIVCRPPSSAIGIECCVYSHCISDLPISWRGVRALR